MKRRAVLRTLGIASIAAWAAPLAGVRLHAAGQAPESRPEDCETPWRNGVAFARWSPSAHNVQPWRLRVISKEKAEVYYDPRRLLPTTDPTSAFTVISLTIFVEYLAIALQAQGFEATIRYEERALDYSAVRPVRFATMQLTPSNRAAEFDPNLIVARRTSRLSYDGNAVDAETLDAVAKIAAREGHVMTSSADPETVKWVLELNKLTMFGDLDDAATRTELRRWIRTSDADAAAHPDGLWSNCLRVPGRLLKGFFDEHQKYVNGWRRAWCERLLMRGMRGTRTVAWWSGPFESPADWIRCGRVLGRSWLELTRRGVQVHPFGSVITNAAAYKQFSSRVGSSASGRGWLLVRMGRSGRPPRSYRVPSADVFLKETELV
jgi:hypothetical protein